MGSIGFDSEVLRLPRPGGPHAWRGAARERRTDVSENKERMPGKRGPKAGTQEARRGGEAVRAKYGRDFFSQIGKKGGDTVRREHGPDFYAQIGKKGGEMTKQRQGHEFYARIGK